MLEFSEDMCAVEEFGAAPTYSVDAMAPYTSATYNGDKFDDSFGDTKLYDLDYWTLRARSNQLFTENLYAAGLIKRLVTNEINKGLAPEAYPDADILGIDSDGAEEWAGSVERRFQMWGRDKRVCDYRGEHTFGALQRIARAEALIAGDVLVVLRQNKNTSAPSIQLISGSSVQTPLDDARDIVHGVERDSAGRVVAYWVQQEMLDYARIPAYGGDGRRLAWLVFGTQRRLDHERGVPLLSLALQPLKEQDRYRDSVQRKATLNSYLAMFIKKNQDKPASLSMTNGATRKGAVTTPDAEGQPRSFQAAKYMPGLILEELQAGEEPQGFKSDGTDLAYGEFEKTIISAVAWANEVPPEILTLAFSNNYSASQAAINEFKIYLEKFWSEWGDGFCAPIYEDWLCSEVQGGSIKAPGLLAARSDISQYYTYGAWTQAEWYGVIKPSTDMFKQARGSSLLLGLGLTTHAKEAKNLTGTKFSANARKLARENKELADALRPLAEFKQEFGAIGEQLIEAHNGATEPEAIND
ncbi:MAG: phage portal protein [Shimia sp.]|nr:phage portal protein [Shimia sp.]